MYRKRRLYSQHFLRNWELVAKLVRDSSIGKVDTVVEIGPGKGIITSELIKAAGNVIAVELDSKLYYGLVEAYFGVDNLKLHFGDISDFNLPHSPFKVFSNIPFVSTSTIIRKLVADPNMVQAYLVVQREAAKKFVGMPYATRNSMFSILIQPWFEAKIVWQFAQADFAPRPRVECVLLQLTRRQAPLISMKNKNLFENYVTYMFSTRKVAKKSLSNWLSEFDNFATNVDSHQRAFINTKAGQLRVAQNKIEKINRTRNDRHWRQYRKSGC